MEHAVSSKFNMMHLNGHQLKKTSRSFLQCHAIMHRGMEIKALEEGTTLRQLQLMCRVIELLHLADANPKPAPVVKPLLSKNVDGK